MTRTQVLHDLNRRLAIRGHRYAYLRVSRTADRRYAVDVLEHRGASMPRDICVE